MEGPSTKTTIVGPEGSVISSVAPGGKIITETLPAVATYSASRVLPSYVAPADVSPYAVPAIYPAQVLAARAAPLISTYETAALPNYRTPILSAYGSANAVISGPSGVVAASRSLNAADLAAPVW